MPKKRKTKRTLLANFKEYPHVTAALEYCYDVVEGQKLACDFNIRACERQLDDLKNHKDYIFDPEAGERVCRFVEKLPHIKGEWARKRLKLELEPWQKFIITTVFGWINPITGTRRYRTVYIEVPRKNAKSTLTSAIGLYMLAADGEAGAECYSAAVTRDQAKIVFNDSQNMARKTPELCGHFGIKVHAHNISVLSTASKFEPLSADGSSLDGLNVHFGAIDELHAHKNRSVFDVIETGTGSRLQSLLWNITTAGFNRAGICYEQRAYSIKLLKKEAVDDTYFCCIWTIDKDDDWADPAIWEKANPNYNASVYPADISRQCRKALEMPSAVNNFLTKRLNVWVNADTAWMDMRKWEDCGDNSFKIEDYHGEKCFIGLDLASKLDVNAKVYIFPNEDSKQYTMFQKFYLPEEQVEISPNSQYQGWARSGRITTTPGNVIDLDVIENELRQDVMDFEVVEIAFDPFQATQMSGHLVDEEIPMVEMRPTVLNFSEPMKELEKLIYEKAIIHDGCPAMEWMISNVVAHTDAKDNIYPRKEFPENKIDGPVASIMALGRAIVNKEERSVYEERGLITT